MTLVWSDDDEAVPSGTVLRSLERTTLNNVIPLAPIRALLEEIDLDLDQGDGPYRLPDRPNLELVRGDAAGRPMAWRQPRRQIHHGFQSHAMGWLLVAGAALIIGAWFIGAWTELRWAAAMLGAISGAVAHFIGLW